MVDEVDLSNYSGAPGDRIVVRAHDDFAVARLQVTVSDSNGQEIERGEAMETPPNGGQWMYTASATVAEGTLVRITVTASDQPGGMSQETFEKSL